MPTLPQIPLDTLAHIASYLDSFDSFTRISSSTAQAYRIYFHRLLHQRDLDVPNHIACETLYHQAKHYSIDLRYHCRCIGPKRSLNVPLIRSKRFRDEMNFVMRPLVKSIEQRPEILSFFHLVIAIYEGTIGTSEISLPPIGTISDRSMIELLCRCGLLECLISLAPVERERCIDRNVPVEREHHANSIGHNGPVTLSDRLGLTPPSSSSIPSQDHVRNYLLDLLRYLAQWNSTITSSSLAIALWSLTPLDFDTSSKRLIQVLQTVMILSPQWPMIREYFDLLTFWRLPHYTIDRLSDVLRTMNVGSVLICQHRWMQSYDGKREIDRYGMLRALRDDIAGDIEPSLFRWDFVVSPSLYIQRDDKTERDRYCVYWYRKEGERLAIRLCDTPILNALIDPMLLQTLFQTISQRVEVDHCD